MSTIKLFQFSQKFYKRIGIDPSQSNVNSKSINWKNLLVLFVLIHFCISSFAYFLFEAKSTGERANSFYMSATELICIIFFSINIHNIDEIRSLIDKFEAFIQKSKSKWIKIIAKSHKNKVKHSISGSKNSVSKFIYIELNKKIEWMSKQMYHILIDGSFVAAIFPATLITAINYFWHDLGDQSYFTPFLMMWIGLFFWLSNYFRNKKFSLLFFFLRMPFNWKAPLGYVAAMLIQTIDVYYTGLCGLPIGCFLFGGCILLKTIIVDITNDLSKLGIVQNSEQDRIDMKLVFCDIIHDFSQAKRLRL